MIVHLTGEAQAAALKRHETNCQHRMETDENNITGIFCNRTWDNIMCWPDTPAGRIVYQPCPSYINGFNTAGNATRYCLPNGTWFVHEAVNSSGDTGWTNFNFCLAPPEYHDDDQLDLGVANMVLKHMNEFRLMYNIGYALSLVCLLLAVGVMLYFRRLHCARNAIHLNLFLAFILRALMNTIRENLFVGGIGFPGDIDYTVNNTMYFKEGEHWECRFFFSLYQYVLAASYIWIFIEGLYLHMLIFVSVFTEKSRILWYMLFGWSLPVPFVVAWAVSRSYIDNTLCWNTSNNSPGLTWIMKGLVMVSIILNFLFFISIVRVLFTKLTSSHCPESKKLRYRRLARSTLVLIPIFGVYFLVFAFPMDNLDDTTSFIMLFIEMFFNSYQGVIIAIVLCFANAEVRGEVRKAWNRFSLRRNSAVSLNHSHGRYRRQSKEAMSEAGHEGNKRGKKRRGCLKNDTSITNFEETLPLNDVPNGDINKGDEPNTDMNRQLPQTNPTDLIETFDDDGLKVKINICNIQRSSKDDTESAVSTLHIETLHNGTKLNETQHCNNNMEPIKESPVNNRYALQHENTILVA